MVYDIFSKRKRRENVNSNDVYQYKTIPMEARIQIVHLWKRSIGNGGDYTRSQDGYESICNVLREEYGVFNLSSEYAFSQDPFEELVKFFLEEKNIERCLDVIELTMRLVKNGVRDSFNLDFKEVQETLNARLREASVGFQYEGERIIKVADQLVHSEVIKPAIEFLSDPAFRGANDEFMLAHQDYRAGDYKGCLVESLKAFESTMKIICRLRGWTPEGDTASKLISTLFSKELIPSYLQAQFNGLKSVLESGVPTVRNKTAGHGQGDEIQKVPEYLASYVLHQTAAAILLIAKAHQAKK